MKRFLIFLTGALFLMTGECPPPAALTSPLSQPGQVFYGLRLAVPINPSGG